MQINTPQDKTAAGRLARTDVSLLSMTTDSEIAALAGSA
jgi:hypothetical protein